MAYDPAPMNWREKAQAYRTQVWLHARKECEMCGTYLDVSDFEGWGAQPCEECRAELLKRSPYRPRDAGRRHVPPGRLSTKDRTQSAS